MNRDVKMDVQLDVPTEGYAGRIEVVAGPTGRRWASIITKHVHGADGDVMSLWSCWRSP